MIDLRKVVQEQLYAQGIHGYSVSLVSPAQTDVRQFLSSRIRIFAERRPDAPILKMARPALKRLFDVPMNEIIFRWEANSPIGRIVGYSTANTFVGIFPWVMRERDWVASVIRF